MCGIAGIFSFGTAPPLRALLEEMTQLLAHRGPDAEGFEIIDQVALGHKRLSIVDLECGQQPMQIDGGNVLISLNGEIFNYVELRNELKAAGCQFHTSSDTEVVLHGFAKSGTDFFKKLNGQFAFALYHRPERTLYLVRDRMGEKPLYYHINKDALVFASEVKSIQCYLHLLGRPSELSRIALAHFLSLNYVPFQQTFLKGVASLEPGYFLKINSETVRKEFYWDSPPRVWDRSLDQSLDELEQLCADAVRLRLRADVPVGIFLSGGIDSSIIARFAQRAAPQLTAFIASFADQSFSEEETALRTCAQLGISHKLIRIDPLAENLPELLPRLAYHLDTPLADSSGLAVYLLSRETAKHVKVVLSGDGGDELFAGYLTYRATQWASRMPHFLRSTLHAFHPLMRFLPAGDVKVGWHEKIERFLRSCHLPPGQAHFAWNGYFDAVEKMKLLHPDLRAEFLKEELASERDTFEKLRERLGVDAQKPTITQLCLADQLSYLQFDILPKVDRMSMAHGLEARPCFMDHRLVEFSRSLSPELLFHAGKGRVLLRKMAERQMPWYNLQQRKQGFSIPVHKWFRSTLKEFGSDLFSSELVRESGFYDAAYVQELWRSHLARKRNLGFELWGIMMSLLWYKQFKKV